MRGFKTVIKYLTIALLLILISCTKKTHEQKDYDIYGVYLPVEYIETLERTKHNPKSWAAFTEKKDGNRDRLFYMVDLTRIHVMGLDYDGTALLFIEDIVKLKFEKVKNNVYLTDKYNNKYKRIPGEIYDYEYLDGITPVQNFIGNTILDELIKNSDAALKNGIVTIPALNNKRYWVQFHAFNPEKNINLEFEEYVQDNSDDIYLVIKNNEYIFYRNDYKPENIIWSKNYGKK